MNETRILTSVGLLVLGVVLGGPADAQSLVGWVRDSATNMGLSGGRVTLIGSSGDTVAQLTTDVTGRFQYRGDHPGEIIVSLLRVGYEPRVFPPVEFLDSIVQINYYMEPLAFQLNPILVEAVSATALAETRYLQEEGFYRRQQSLWGKFLSPERIDALRDRVMTADDFVRHATFMIPVPGGRRGYQLRCGRPTLYVDGRLFPGEDLDQAVHQDDVMAIEVIEKNAVFVPRYGDCAILLWTKDAPWY